MFLHFFLRKSEQFKSTTFYRATVPFRYTQCFIHRKFHRIRIKFRIPQKHSDVIGLSNPHSFSLLTPGYCLTHFSSKRKPPHPQSSHMKEKIVRQFQLVVPETFGQDRLRYRIKQESEENTVKIQNAYIQPRLFPAADHPWFIHRTGKTAIFFCLLKDQCRKISEELLTLFCHV